MVIDFIIVLLVCAGVVFIFWALFGFFVTPIRCPGGRMFTLICLKGDAPELQRTVQGILWLKHGSIAGMDIVIVDEGLSKSALDTAKAICAKESCVFLCPDGKLEALVGEAAGASQTSAPAENPGCF